MKVTINGETFDWDGAKAPMSEALAIERVYKRNYAQWQTDLGAGSAEAMAVLAWLIWRRDGRDVAFVDIIDGTTDFDLLEMLTSLAESAQAETDAAAEAEAAAEVPTQAGSDPAGTPGTGTGMSASSPSGSKSARGKSRS